MHLGRYCADCIIPGSSKEGRETEGTPLVEAFWQARGLALAPAKTRITQIEDGFDCLGPYIRRYQDGKRSITPAKKHGEAVLAKIRGRSARTAQATAGKLIRQLNPLRQGWANSHRHVSSKETFVKINHAIFHALWQWAHRRHPNKPLGWIKEKYFTTVGGDTGVLQGTVEGKEGKPQPVSLLQAASVPSKRHTKIQGEANPDDPAWAQSCERRSAVKMAATLQGRRQRLTLYKEQEGIGPLGRPKITEITEWHRHHIIGRSHGGNDLTENLVLLHPECPRQVQSLKLAVVKPRPEKGVHEARAD